MRIFVSHQSREKAIVREFVQLLPEYLAKDVLISDENAINWGDDLNRKINDQILLESDFLIIFVSNSSLESEWVMKELNWALERESEIERTFVLPILLCDLETRSIPPVLSERLVLKLYDYLV